MPVMRSLQVTSTVWVKSCESSQGPDGKDVAVAGVGDGTRLVEHTLDTLLQEK